MNGEEAVVMKKTEKTLSAVEMGVEIANRYLHGGYREREIILSCFTDEEKETFLRFISYYKLYCDQAYYDAVKKAVLEQLKKDWAR